MVWQRGRDCSSGQRFSRSQFTFDSSRVRLDSDRNEESDEPLGRRRDRRRLRKLVVSNGSSVDARAATHRPGVSFLDAFYPGCTDHRGIVGIAGRPRKRYLSEARATRRRFDDQIAVPRSFVRISTLLSVPRLDRHVSPFQQYVRMPVNFIPPFSLS